MDSKQILLTVVISLVVALVTALVTANVVSSSLTANAIKNPFSTYVNANACNADEICEVGDINGINLQGMNFTSSVIEFIGNVVVGDAALSQDRDFAVNLDSTFNRDLVHQGFGDIKFRYVDTMPAATNPSYLCLNTLNTGGPDSWKVYRSVTPCVSTNFTS